MKKTTIIAAFPSSPSSGFEYAEALAREALERDRGVALAVALKSEPPAAVAAKSSAMKREAGAGQRAARARKTSSAKEARAKDPPSKSDRAKAAFEEEPAAEKTQNERTPEAGVVAARSGPDGILRLSLRPGSSLSTRSVFLESANALGPILELVLVLEPGGDGRGVFGSDPAEAEAFAEERVKAYFQLLREAGQRFGKLPGSSLAIALPESPRAANRPLSGFSRMERDFLFSLGDACMAESAIGGRVFGLRGESGGARDFAKALFRMLDDPKGKGAGRWTKSGGGFLGIL